MKNILIALVTVFTISSAFAFPGHKEEGRMDRDPMNDHQLTVGNEKAISGTNAEDKSVREHKMHKSHNHKGKANGHFK